MTSIAYFISSHGYGHATRAASVMQAMSVLDPTIHFEIFTQIPAWLFTDTLPPIFTHHAVLTDIGLAQHSSLVEDLTETQRRLEQFYPLDPLLVESLAAQVRHCSCVLCDIAPLGIMVAQAVGIPSILIENFTWDWIYEGYLAAEPRLAKYIDYLRGLFAQATYHVQTEPVCQPQTVDLTVFPVSRPMKASAAEIRQQLALPLDAPMILVTMGGVAQPLPDLSHFREYPQLAQIYWVIAGQTNTIQHGQIITLGQSSGFYHPDLINASDAVIGKVGYSTLAEVYHAGVPYGYVARPHFRESVPLVAFIEQHMAGLPIREADFMSGQWQEQLVRLLALPRQSRPKTNGAVAIATMIKGLLD